ncbi:uncharacterized protein EI90DRAFT_3089737 [Cantharellus anzutake]|uniref:uncharacterized protein n=1 Tax=Cantharellus anzutake TaxID=1750568 RepID=UPI001908BE21|nr:uncharacterized protein EI90DRAFT_3089737 [Cantharellus anzutake]KAF8314629.1 hypothetical protein EI90DRAFT_3089737 [Cantharellus anzutake]
MSLQLTYILSLILYSLEPFHWQKTTQLMHILPRMQLATLKMSPGSSVRFTTSRQAAPKDGITSSLPLQQGGTRSSSPGQ